MLQKDFGNETSYSVLDPAGLERKRSVIPPSPRIPDLTDKVIYCVSQHIAGADSLLERVADALPRTVPRIKSVYRRRNSSFMTDEPELWDEIAEKADGVIYGCCA
jgi:hypothetical protein